MSDSAELLFKQKINHQLTCKLSRKSVNAFLDESFNFLLPGMINCEFKNSQELSIALQTHLNNLKKILPENLNDEIAKRYEKALPILNQKILLDAKATLDGDPAAKDLAEVVLSYPGIIAIASYRLAHFFYLENIQILPRLITEIAHEKTGIDIHPGASIGESFFIDHGTGIVIGESAVIGNHVKMYQGVTLGALSVDKSMAQKKRHPTIEDYCVIYSHATILGGDTIIGAHSVIGGNVWMTRSVAAHSIVYHKSEVKLDSLPINLAEELTYEI
jgi:serine O-acetyltransferase